MNELKAINELNRLIHFKNTRDKTRINIDKCLELLNKLDTVFNYDRISFSEWSEYIINNLSSNLLDYDELNIIIHPGYETYDIGYQFQNNFSGGKNYTQYIIPDKSNKNKAHLHIFIKDFIYELDAIVIFLLINILFLEKNKNDIKTNMKLIKDKKMNGCTRKQCYVQIINRLTNKVSKTKKQSHKLSNNDKEYIKHIRYDKPPRYNISVSSVHYKKLNNLLEYNAEKWANHIKSLTNEHNVHIIFGYQQKISKIFEIDGLEDGIINKLKHDTKVNCASIIINLDKYMIYYKKNKIVKDSDFERIVKSIKKYRNTSFILISVPFGINSYYLTKSLVKTFDSKIQSINSIGSCGGLDTNMNIGDVVIQKSFVNWCKIMRELTNESPYMNINDVEYKAIVDIDKIYEININQVKMKKIINKIQSNRRNMNMKELPIWFGNSCTVSITPYETKQLLLEMQKHNIDSIEMEGFWIKKACGDIPGLFMHYISDLPIKEQHPSSFSEKNNSILDIIEIIINYLLG
jgi:purine-nucleoside phosphorylase